MSAPLRALPLVALVLVLTLAAALAGVLVGANRASAHPLGNFSVNQYHDLELRPGLLTDHAVLDLAEIPTLQAEPDVDTDHDGRQDPAELAAHAARICDRLAHALRADSDGTALGWSVRHAAMRYRPGAAGLNTSRFTCELTAPVRARGGSRITFRTDYLTDRVGWREITAHGSDPHLTADVPARSVSDRLRSYPQDLLGDPLDVREATLRLGAAGAAAPASLPGAGLFTRVQRLTVAWDRHLADLTAARRLTLPLGLGALALALALGAAHAALPGHGKTLMAAAMAGRRGGVRDAVVVGTTVTLTHTGGVLATGLLLTTTAGLAGERLLGWFAVVSGVLVTATGAALLRGALRAHGHRHEHRGHVHAHGHDHVHAHSHGHSHAHSHGHAPGRARAALVGMGVAGGLVPSPTALVVLLGAVALDRTFFGVVLVLAYGVGMAATLTAAGLLIARAGLRAPAWLRDRLPHVGRLRRWTPVLTATVVTLVGLGLVARASVAGA